jgi:hypothetical protein
VRYGGDFVAAQRRLKPEWSFDSYRAALRSWIATVAVVEVGYVGECEEYANELMSRDYLEELMRLSPSSRPAIEEDLRIWDVRFRAATIEETEPHLPPTEGNAGWWQYRSPRSWLRPAAEDLGLPFRSQADLRGVRFADLQASFRNTGPGDLTGV